MQRSAHSPDLRRISEIVLGWLTHSPPDVLKAQVAGWDEETWGAARWAIQVHGIGPLLDWAIARRPEAQALHPHLRAYLADQRRLSGERVALLLHDLAEVLEACAAAGIEVIPLKGSVLASRYYPEQALRPMSDLDVLVRPVDEARTIETLARLGYRALGRSWKHLSLARPQAQGKVVAYNGEHPDNPRGLDLHTQLTEQFWGIRYDLTAAAWDDSAPGTLQGRAARLMRPNVLLRHLLIHTSYDIMARRARALQLQDIALVAAKLDSSEWAQIVADAHARGDLRFVYPALALTNRYYQVVPDAVLVELRAGMPAALLRYLDASPIDRLSYCNSAPTTIGERLCWYRPGRERIRAVRYMLVPDPNELTSSYPRMAHPALMPLAYARYGADIIGWGLRRALGMPRLRLWGRHAGVRG